MWLESEAKESGTPVLMSRLSVQCMAHSILKCVKPIFKMQNHSRLVFLHHLTQIYQHVGIFCVG